MRNEKRDGYYKTEVGWIPTEWGCDRLLEHTSKIGSGVTPTGGEAVYESQGITFIRSQNILIGEFTKKGLAYIPSYVHDEMQNSKVIPGDVLYNITGASIGRCCLFPQDLKEANVNQHVCIIRPTRELTADFLMQVLNSSLGERQLYQSQAGGGRQGLNYKNLGAFYMPFPSFDEQQKISQILSTWDRTIERVQRLIEARQRQKARLVSRLLSGQMRFPGFQDEWQQVKLGTFLHPKFRKVVKPAGAYLRLGIRSHGKGTFTSVVDDPETIALTHLFQARKDDLIVNITFAWEGAIALVGPDGDGALVSHRFPTYVFDTSKMMPEYFKHLMVTDRFFYELDLISPGGAGRNRVMNKGDFLKITVTIPGVKEQKKIAGVLGGMDEQIGLLKKYLEKLKKQKNGLMQKLLTGEIRVKVD